MTVETSPPPVAEVALVLPPPPMSWQTLRGLIRDREAAAAARPVDLIRGDVTPAAVARYVAYVLHRTANTLELSGLTYFAAMIRQDGDELAYAAANLANGRWPAPDGTGACR